MNNMFNIRHNKKDKSFYNNWFSFYYKFSNFSIVYEHGGYDEDYPQIHICLGFGDLFINLPFHINNEGCENPRYGFYWFEGKPWFLFDKKIKTYRMPWNFEWYRTQTLLNDGSWYVESKIPNLGKSHRFVADDEYLEKNAWNTLIPFTYIFPENVYRKGEKQHRVAKITIKRMEWRRNIFKNFKMFNLVRTFVDYDFNDEVGLRSGSWKGGVLGSSVEVLPNETYEEAFKRAVETIISKY